MQEPIKVAIIGLDTSHSVALPKLMQDPETPAENRVPELRAVSCLRFDTPFQNKEGLDNRQAYLESIGVPVTENFDEAVADCDAIMLTINDPSLHLKYFEKCAPLGKPVFLDKPFADSIESMQKIIALAKQYNVRFFTSSSLRYDVDLAEGIAKCPGAKRTTIWAPVGKAAAGSDIVWYGCHAFEMLETVMGKGAVTVSGYKDDSGYVFQVAYADGRRGSVELTSRSPYGAVLRDEKFNCTAVNVSGRVPYYQMLLQEIVRFFKGSDVLALEDSVEVMAMIAAADRAIASGKIENVYDF
jgi:predicted dehydrogenase